MYYSSVGPDTGKRLDPHRYRYGVGCRLDPASGVRSQESGQHADGTRRRVRCRLDLLNRDLSDLKRDRVVSTGGQGRTELPSREILRYSRIIFKHVWNEYGMAKWSDGTVSRRETALCAL